MNEAGLSVCAEENDSYGIRCPLILKMPKHLYAPEHPQKHFSSMLSKSARNLQVASLWIAPGWGGMVGTLETRTTAQMA